MTLTGQQTRLLLRRPATTINEVDLARRRLGFFPDARQSEVLLSQAKRVILNCARQWGKSTITAAKALYRALSMEDCLVLVASPSRRQSAEWMRKARRMVARMGIVPCGDGDNEVSLRLPKNSRIVGLPGVPDTTRGFSSVSLLIIDE